MKTILCSDFSLKDQKILKTYMCNDTQITLDKYTQPDKFSLVQTIMLLMK